MAVKPDVFAPGGRAVYARQLGSPPGPKSYRRVERPLEVPGTRVAAPSPRGTLYSYGTSNAAAETTRVAEGLLSVVRAVVSNVPHLREVPEALLVKALLVHTAEWAGGAYEVVRRALRTPENASIFDDLVSAFLGYGVLRSERAHACTPDRVTLLGGEVIGEGETRLHRIPLPAALNAFTSRRKLTTTLAWFSPINPNHRKYRCAALSFVPLKDGRTPLLLGNADVHLNAVKRGTIQHVVLERDSGAINVRENDALEVAVTCEFESQSGMGIRVPYALAVTLEVAPGLAVPIYDAVREMVRPRVRSR
jgi:hypothetical protein